MQKSKINRHDLKKDKYKLIGMKERLIKGFFALNGYVTIIFIILIFAFLISEGLKFLNLVNLKDILFYQDQSGEYLFQWVPTSENPKFSILPLIAGSFVISFTATFISTICGIVLGIFLAEVASENLRELLKPIIELFAGIPTVVLGFFVLVFVASVFDNFFEPTNRLNAFIASLGLSLIVIPIITSLTEDAIRSIPNHLRMASYALGANKWETLKKVILPASVNGISAGIILGFGRAIGETMIVLMVSGNAANFTLDIFTSLRTFTATIAAELGEVSYESTHYYALFFIGLVLFVLTFFLNLFADLILNYKNKYRKKWQ